VAIGELTAGAEGQWTAPMTPVRHDWVLVLERKV